MKRYVALEAPVVHLKGTDYNLLGDHFHPLLALLAPIYAVAPSPLTLLLVQAGCFGLAAGVLTRTGTQLLGPIRGGCVGIAFGLSWGLQTAAAAQFHEIALAVPLLTLSLCALVRGASQAAALWAAPLVWVKEDLGLTVVVVGALLALRRPRELGLALVVWGLAWFLVTTTVILPALNPAHEWAYGLSHGVSGSNWTTHLLAPEKLETLVLLLLATCGVALASPVALVAIPTLCWRFIADNPGYWGPGWHYSAVLMPIVFVAVLDALSRAHKRRSPPRQALRRGAPVAIALVSLILLPRFPLGGLLSGWDDTTSSRARAADAAVRVIPIGATVESDIGLMTYLVADHDVFWIGNSNPPQTCVVIDAVAGGVADLRESAEQIGERLHEGVDYTMVFSRDGYEVACRR